MRLLEQVLVKARTGQHNYTSQIDPVGQWGAASPPISSRVEKKQKIEGDTRCNSQADRGNRNTGGIENQRAGIQHV